MVSDNTGRDEEERGVVYTVEASSIKKDRVRKMGATAGDIKHVKAVSENKHVLPHFVVPRFYRDMGSCAYI